MNKDDTDDVRIIASIQYSQLVATELKAFLSAGKSMERLSEFLAARASFSLAYFRVNFSPATHIPRLFCDCPTPRNSLP